MVTPCVGVWIEIIADCIRGRAGRSLPAWECGLKSISSTIPEKPPSSLPAWECGLKSVAPEIAATVDIVTPCVGVWIEISPYYPATAKEHRHSLRGSVD